MAALRPKSLKCWWIGSNQNSRIRPTPFLLRHPWTHDFPTGAGGDSQWCIWMSLVDEYIRERFGPQS